MRRLPAPIAVRITLLYVALLAAFLLALDLFAYTALRGVLLNDQRSMLRVAAGTVARQADASARPPRLGQPLPPGLEVQLYRRDGTYLGGSGDARDRLPIDDRPPAFARSQAPEIWGDVVQPGEDGPRHWLVLTVPADAPHLPGAYLRLAAPLDSLDTTLGELSRILALGTLTVLILALLLGPAAARRALRPLRAMAGTAERIASGDLSQRTRLSHGTDEVGGLAQAFDTMVGRLEASFAAQRATEERLRQFAADASHELRTPLTSLRGYVDVLSRGAKDDPADSASALDAMRREALRLERLTSDLLDLTRLDSGLAADLESFDLASLVAERVTEARRMSAAIRWASTAGLTVRADRRSLGRAIDNLIENARRYTAAGRDVVVTLARDGEDARIDVRDFGCGIPDADLPRIFDRFYRGDSARSRHTGGAGLGLAIVRAIVEAHGGHVGVRSVAGQGSTFSIVLPSPRLDAHAAGPRLVEAARTG